MALPHCLLNDRSLTTENVENGQSPVVAEERDATIADHNLTLNCVAQTQLLNRRHIFLFQICFESKNLLTRYGHYNTFEVMKTRQLSRVLPRG